MSTRKPTGVRFVATTWLAVSAAFGLGTGCGRSETPKPQSATRPAPAAPAPAPKVPAPVVAAPAAPAPVAATTNVAAPVAAVATSSEVREKIEEILELEQRAEFGKAFALCSALQGRALEGAELEEVRALMFRLREERKAVTDLSVAIDSLGDHREVSEQQLLKNEAVGLLLLRRAVRERDGAVLAAAASILASRNDLKTADVIVRRLKTCKDEAVFGPLLGSLDVIKDGIDPALTADFVAAVAGADAIKSHVPILSILAVLSARETATNVVAAVYRQAQQGTTFKNRYAATFLGMVRVLQYKNDAKAFGEAVGDPEAAASLSKYMLDLAAHRDPKETNFFMRLAKIYPELVRTYENTVPIGGWSSPTGIDGFTQTPEGHLVGTITGPDPYFMSQDNLNLDLSRYKTIKLSFQNRTGSKAGRFLFVTNEDQGFGEDKTAAYASKPNDPGFTEYVIDMSSHPKWKGVLKQLRFDIVDDGAKGQFDVASVMLSDAAAPRK